MGSAAIPTTADAVEAEDARLAAVIAAPKVGLGHSTLVLYFKLQPGRWWEWACIWLLQNARYCPVYILPLLTGYLIDHIRIHHPEAILRLLPWVLLGTVGLCILTVGSNSLGRVMMSRISRNLTAQLRLALLKRINRLAFSFHDRGETGELQNKFTLDMARLEGYEAFIAESLFMYGTVVLVMMAIVARTNLLLFVILLIAVPVNVLLVRVFWGRITALNEEYRRAENTFLTKLNEALSGLRMNRAHATEQFAEERVKQAATNVAHKAIRLDLMSNLFGSGSWAITTFLNMAVVGIGVWLVASGVDHLAIGSWSVPMHALTLGQFTILVAYYGTISGSVGAILGSLPAVAAAEDAIRSLSQLYRDDDEEHGAGRGAMRLPTLQGDIRFEQVCFAYPGVDRHCLADVDLHIPAGTSVALVGPSGGGKSTIASLLLGFYTPTRGRILVDGRDLMLLDRRSFRQHVGVVSQDVVLFQDSLLANITWGDPHPDERRAQLAAERAHAMEFISRMPGGLHHHLGDRGGGLSGGQRQRLAIARALYRDPRLLILDEATSALDLDSERAVQKALDELKQNRTTLIIAHRLSTIRSADRIVVIKDGTLIEQGAFAALSTANGFFAQLVSGQVPAVA